MKFAAPILRRRCGFTLIEMVAVLAVLALVAAAVIPLLLRQLDELTRQQEQETLQTLAKGLEKYVGRTRTIPAATNLLILVGAEVGLSANEAQFTARGGPRVVLVDPNLHLGQYTAGPPATGGLLPFTQVNSGSLQPLSPRVMILSSLGPALPATLVNGVPSNATFTNIWNVNPNSIPSLWSWTGRGADLRIQRVDMSQWFFQISLNRSGVQVGRYAIDAGAPQAPPTFPYSPWLIRGSKLSLYSPVGGLASIFGGLQASEIVDLPLSFICDNGVWRDRRFTSTGARMLQGFDVQLALTSFNSAPDNPSAQSGTTKAQVVAAMQTYLAAFQAWSSAGYPSGSLNNAVKTAQADMAQLTANLIKHL